MPMSKQIFVTEDEADILELVRLKLETAGYTTRGFTRAHDLLDRLRQELPELILLDLMLPDLDGLEACRRIKSNPAWEKIPIVMLTARSDIEDRVRGLEFGADDYITKPFDSKELLARVKAVLRRSGWESARNVLNINSDFRLDFNRYEAWIRGRRVDLTLTEFKILQLLTAGRAGYSNAARSSIISGATTRSCSSARWTFTSAICARNWVTRPTW